MMLIKYATYDDYVKTQIEWSVKKRNVIWVENRSLDMIIDYIKRTKIKSPYMLCHGVRNGYEVDYIKKNIPDINIIGTEISEKTAGGNENIIQWDFHEVKREWVDNIDFIYSNSLDHSYDPDKCIKAWMRCLKKTGVCFVEWSVSHAKPSTESDCFIASLAEYLKLFNKYKVKTLGITSKRKMILITK
jgi:hypothetical protein